MIFALCLYIPSLSSTQVSIPTLLPFLEPFIQGGRPFKGSRFSLFTRPTTVFYYIYITTDIVTTQALQLLIPPHHLIHNHAHEEQQPRKSHARRNRQRGRQW